MGFFDNDAPNKDFSNPLFGSSDLELNRILGDPTEDVKTRQTAREVQNMERSIRRAGLDPGDSQPRSSFFGDVLDTLDAPRQGVMGMIDTLFRGDAFEGDVGTGFRRGQNENVTFSDVLRRNDLIDNPILRGGVGLAGDILADPLTYLSLGSSAGAKVGGRVLAEGGLALNKLVHERALAQGITDVVQRSAKVDETFRAIGRYQEYSKFFDKAVSPSEKALEADNMAKAMEGFGSLVNASEVVGKGIFEKPALRIGANIPFLGHITGDADNVAVEVLNKDPGPVGQALRLADKVFKPGKLNIATLQLSDETVNAFDNIRLFADHQLGKIASTLGDYVGSVPMVGPAAVSVTKGLKNTFDAANTLLRKIFYQSSLVSRDFNNARLDYVNLRSQARLAARDQTIMSLGEDLLSKPDIQKEIYLAIDAQALGALKDSKVEGKDVLDTINRIRTTGTIHDGDQLLFRDMALQSGAEQGFRSRIDNLMIDPNVHPEVKAGIQKTMKAMDDLALEENKHGLGYSRLEYYVPHRYLSASQGGAKGGAESFLKSRKYDTVGQAFEESGKVADTSLADLLSYRFEKSFLLRAQDQFAKRVMVEESINPELISNLYKEAQMNPAGPAAGALKRYKIKLKPLDAQAIKDGTYISERQKIYAGVGLKDPVASELLAEHASVFHQKTTEELWAAGVKPLDNRMPREGLGELGEKIELKSGGSMFLPKPIADAYKETLAARDILKDALGTSAFGSAMLSAMDNTTGFFKRFVTLPWPAYWAQNFVGDRFNQAMQGLHAIAPGLHARTYSVLKGESAIKSATGMVLNKPMLEKVIKQFGLSYKVGDHIGAVEAFGKMNIEKFLAEKNSLFDNLKSIGTKSNRQAAFSQAGDLAQKTFDGFFRVNHFVHRFEQGDSIADAARAAQEAYFNYRDMSPVESSLFRRFYMFYGYMSKATKQTVTNLVTNPGNLTLQLHGSQALAEFFSDPNAAPTAEMHEAKLLNSAVTNEQLSRVVGRNKDGKPIVGRGFSAPLNAVLQQFSVQTPRSMSVGELIDTASDSARRTLQKQFATSNPMINSVAQLVSGKNLYFDKPLDAEFLRKLPSLNAAAEKLAGYKHDELPLDLDAATKFFLRAVPDGKGRLIADPSRMWILVNLIPGMGRAISTGGAFANADIGIPQALLKAGLGVNLQDTDVSRTYLSTRKSDLASFMNAHSVKQINKNNEEDN